MLHLIYDNDKLQHPGKSSVVFLPIIDMAPSDKTCLLSTLTYLANLAHSHHVPAIITFDQPLFWKASEIVSSARYASSLINVVVMLGPFHTLMNILGAIGTLMEGSGLREVLQEVYSDNIINHILSGKAVARALRAHLLVDRCLYTQIVSQAFPDEQNEYNELLHEVTSLYEFAGLSQQNSCRCCM